MTTATAVARESAWLGAVDALPSLLSVNGGPWGVVQGFWPGNRFAAEKTGLYVDARELDDQRASSQRIRPQYEFTIRAEWPLKGSAAPIAETAQQAFSNALDLLLQRIRGPLGDKTHGGRFLSVAENPRTVRVTKEDPAVTIPADQRLRATVTYKGDDWEISG